MQGQAECMSGPLYSPRWKWASFHPCQAHRSTRAVSYSMLLQSLSTPTPHWPAEDGTGQRMPSIVWLHMQACKFRVWASAATIYFQVLSLMIKMLQIHLPAHNTSILCPMVDTQLPLVVSTTKISLQAVKSQSVTAKHWQVSYVLSLSLFIN